MLIMNAMTPLTDILEKLKSEGYTQDFNIADDCIICSNNNTTLDPSTFRIDRYFRFEGETDPSDQAIVYAISSKDGTIKGVLVNSYGLYSDEKAANIISLLEHPSK
ncbi:phosphoribosylpyrophosphate synthetase [Sphingobacterium olei]|uniref:Phosphoribosylpyrophosphate synthetase n=2 Tax=Sphingobacterium olei TaxID=2571155 RepID=A0A4U0PKU5_9SPHI|nr:phosphoribosylpyrophosphate synthetase [Sphingobacterium olei]